MIYLPFLAFPTVPVGKHESLCMVLYGMDQLVLPLPPRPAAFSLLCQGDVVLKHGSWELKSVEPVVLNVCFFED